MREKKAYDSVFSGKVSFSIGLRCRCDHIIAKVITGGLASSVGSCKQLGVQHPRIYITSGCEGMLLMLQTFSRRIGQAAC